MKYFETHCHLDFPDFDRDREEVINKCTAAGVKYFINVGIDTETIKKSLALAEKWSGFFAACGYHPNYADRYDKAFLLDHLSYPKVVAVGEIGLDYYRNFTCKDLQKEILNDQLKIAVDKDLPVIIHNRQADDDCWRILEQYAPKKVVFHCFAGDISLADKIWERGWYISVTAAVTYKNCKINEVIEKSPIDKIMSETDCPFLAPQHIRGKRNDPSSLPYIIKRIAELKSLPVNIAAQQMFDNACSFFLKKT